MRDIINDSITEIVNENSRDLTVVADSVNKAHLDLVKKDILNNILNQSDKIADNLYKESKISVIMEYSRSIHAEMDVITTMARTSKENTKGKVLYTTTYPCHNCARHIVSSGIKKVIYIEPFEKSLALDLHDDAISKSESSKKVSFIEFEGVSPRRYNKFFYPTDERKDDDGVARKFNVKYKNHIDVQYLDSYLTYQIEVSKRFLKSARPDLGRTDI
ncbi:deaminase [Dickeya oryzae]